MLYLDWHRSDGGVSTVEIQYLLPAAAESMFVLPTKAVHTGTFEYMSRWRKAYPLLTLTDRGKELNVIGQPGSSYYDGKGNLDAVYAGTGTPDELAKAKVKGKIALVTRSDGLTGSERAQAAAAAGAALLIVVNDQPGKLFEWVGQDDGSRSAVPVATLTLAQGGPLIERIRTKLGVEGVPNSPYVYDLVDPHAGRVPADLTYKPKPTELATVQMRFHGTTPYASGEFRWDYRPYRTVAFGLLQAIDMPGTRTDYVSAQPGTAWAEDMLTGPTFNLESRTGIHTYTAGRSTVGDWYAPVAHPRNGPGFWWSDRQQAYAEFNIQPWTDSGTDHGGYMVEGETIAFDVYQDGTLVSSGPWASAGIYPVPDQTVTFRLDLKASRDPVFRLSTRTHTEWTVVSPKVSDPLAMDTMAVLQLDYQVDTNLAGDARGGRQTVGLSASHLPGAVGGGRIQGATFAVSYDDGQTWRPVTLAKNGTGAWTAQFDAPQSGFVSVRAKAWDDKGNSINQEVIRAYGLT